MCFDTVCYAPAPNRRGIKRWCCLTSVCRVVWLTSVAYIMTIHGDHSYWKQSALGVTGVRRVWAGAGSQRAAYRGVCISCGLAHSLLNDGKGIRACKKSWVLVCWWWRFDWSFARLIASSFASIKQANLDSPGKWPLKRSQRERNPHMIIHRVPAPALNSRPT